MVIGIESYPFVTPVQGAVANANDWYAWLTKSRKVPLGKVRLLRDREAKDDQIREEAAWAANAVSPGGTLWFIFIGHGAPAKDGKGGVLVGIEAQQTASNLYRRSVPQRELLEALTRGKQAQTIALFDSCFSGKSTEGEPLVPGLQPLIPVSRGAVPTNTVVLTAGASDQFAGPLPGASRPAFSYLVLGALRGWADANGDRTVTAEEVNSYTNDALVALVRDRRQTPELLGRGGVALSSAAKEEGPDLTAFVLSGGSEAVGSGGPPLSRPSIKAGAITQAQGELTISVRPRDGVRLEITGPEGRMEVSGAPYRNSSAKPGSWKVLAKLTGHEELEQRFEVLPDEPTLVKLELKPLGALVITGTPQGATVKVSGPGGFSHEGGLPWEASGLVSGDYRIQVSRDGYLPDTATTRVEAAQTARVSVALAKQQRPSEGTSPNVQVKDDPPVPCPSGMASVRGGTYRIEPIAYSSYHKVPRRDVTLRSFCMDMTEVTVEAYGGCKSCSKPKTEDSCNWGKRDRKKHPLNCVSWTQAEAFCRASGKRLVSEEEWRWVLRGGAQGSKFPWGDEPPGGDVCWGGTGNTRDKDRHWGSCPAGTYSRDRTPEGIFDLVGNLEEWTSGTSADRDGDTLRLVLGGAATSSDQTLPWSLTGSYWADRHEGSRVGFRCALSP